MKGYILEYLDSHGFDVYSDEKETTVSPYGARGLLIGGILKEQGFSYDFREKKEEGSITEYHTYRKEGEVFEHRSFYTTSGGENDFSTDIVRYYLE